jgi:hypothetical protein
MSYIHAISVQLATGVPIYAPVTQLAEVHVSKT